MSKGGSRSPSAISYPDKLYHRIPPWVESGAIFHIRIRCSPANPMPLTKRALAFGIFESVHYYHETHRWFYYLFLLMPDHLHALLSFPRNSRISLVIGDWKRFHRGRYGINWQNNYFDHRIRNDAEFIEKAAYIRRNPIVKGLCVREEDWEWVLPKHE